MTINTDREALRAQCEDENADTYIRVEAEVLLELLDETEGAQRLGGGSALQAACEDVRVGQALDFLDPRDRTMVGNWLTRRGLRVRNGEPTEVPMSEIDYQGVAPTPIRTS